MAPAGEKAPRDYMKKWWKSHEAIDGLVTEHISPFQQKVMAPFFETLPSRIRYHLGNPVKMFCIGGALSYVYLVTKTANHKYDQIHRAHWP